MNTNTIKSRARLRATTALSTALVGSLAVLCAPATRAQDSGASCVMVGNACNIFSQGGPGTDGADGGYDQPGHDGTPGGNGNNITTDLESPRTLENSGAISPVNINSWGGQGGQGGDGSAGGGLANNRGGNGMKGGDGGTLDVTVGPAISGITQSNPNNEVVSAVTIQSVGWTGGAAGVASYELGGQGNGAAGVGGAGGQITATVGGTFVSTPGAGLYVASVGGTGGRGRDSDYAGGSPQAPDGANGGTGGAVDVTVTGNFTGNDYGAFILSQGGDGGHGGTGYSTVGGAGGNGGNGGSGGVVTASLASGATVLSTYSDGAAFYAASIGGVGGVGGGGSAAGNAGTGSDGKAVTAAINGNVYTSGYGDTYGVLIQSIGGAGGAGGHSGSWFNPISGSGASGGQGGAVSVTGMGAQIRMGSTNAADNSGGLVAQSIGGGGGVGPDSNGWFAVGGNGGAGSNGSTVSVALTNTIVSTFGFNSAGVTAQSIGGGGGKGGDACNSSSLGCDGLIVNLTVGGVGGSGGSASDANAAMLGNSVISTINKHSNGLEIQSIGGGGGDGGAAYGKAYSLFYGASISVGGDGGSGGDGGTVNAAQTENNTGQILTFDSDSYGILGQSIGGGGGNGGASTAKAIVKAKGDYPSQSLAMATGGSGAVAGSGAAVYLQSSGLVATTGAGSAGIVAQSIGGGGGTAGDASATSSATGGNLNLAVSLAFGGTGGAAGNGGAAEAMNHGLVLTTGGTASGMLVQSIGGGGGNGGSGDAKSSTPTDVNEGEGDASSSPSASLSFAIGSAGSAGAGGSGGNATATNTGAIITIGDASHGILAQTIGGGGGNAGGGAASTQGQISIAPHVGGSGGAGGDTYYTGTVTANNSGTIVTFGADANGILAQSIGGGGGVGGKAATSIGDAKSNRDGSNGDVADVQSTIGAIENDYDNKGVDAIGDYNTLASATSTINHLLGKIASLGAVGDDPTGDDLDDVGQEGGTSEDSNEAKSISLKVSVGGTGGKGGSGGFIDIANAGGIATTGKMADGIIAQSIGGGGGKGGAASTASSADISGSVAIGGSAGSGGNGGEPTITNSGQVYTMGAESAAIIAQSVGGGGGIGGASTTTVKTESVGSDSEPVVALEVSVGGNGGGGGIAEAATVNNSGLIETRAHDSTGIIAQSVAGGGGIVKTLATDLEGGGGSASASAPDYSIPFEFGGSNGASGNSGAVWVITATGGDIITKGDNSYGVLAQSIAGGGGLAIGGKPLGSTVSDFFGPGSSGSVTGSPNPNDDGVVHVSVGSNISTRGEGSIGVMAQSIGGGGGIAGGIGGQNFGTFDADPSGFTGNKVAAGSGGAIDLTVDQGGSVFTTGGFSTGIVAQSLGGGGGRVTTSDNVFMGSAGGSGTGGKIDIEVDGVVSVTNFYSGGVFAQSQGGTGSSPINVTVGPMGVIQVGYPDAPINNPSGATGPQASAVIYIDHGGTELQPNVVTNNGTVYGYVSSSNAIAVYSSAGYTEVTNNGTMGGDVLLANNGGSGCFTNNGSYVGGDKVTVGPCGVTNNGQFVVASTGTTIVGGLTQGASGVLYFQNDPQTGTVTPLQVVGKAEVGGQVQFSAVPTHKTAPVTVLTATGGVTVEHDPILDARLASQLFTNDLSTTGNDLQVTTNAHFDRASSGLGKAKQTLGGYLQSVWDSGQSIGGGFTKFSGVDPASSAFSSNLDSLSGQALGAIAATRYRAGQTFVNNMLGGCPDHEENGRCVWGHFADSTTDRGTTDDVLGYHLSEQTYQFGIQAPVRQDLYLGGSFEYQHATLNDNGGFATVSGDNFMGGATLTWRPGQWRLSGGVDVGGGSYGSTRRITVGGESEVSTASPSFYDAGLHVRAAYDLPLGGVWDLKPYASLHFRWAHGDAYTESGTGDFNLAVASENHLELSGDVGARLRASVPVGRGLMLRPYATAAVEGLAGSDWAARARFVGDTITDGFKVSTPLPGALGEFAAGFDLTKGDRWSLRAQFGRDEGRDYSDQTWTVRVGLAF